MNPSFRIGIDLGGTKIEAIALDSRGSVLLRHRVPTPAGDAEATIAAIRDLVLEVEAKLGGTGTVGIGTPGSLSPVSGLLRNANSTCLNGLPLDKLIAAALGREVRIANDANCFALSEAADGAAAGAPVVFGVILGTGVGGGVVIDGKLLHGRHAIGGEWGHNPLPWPTDAERPGPLCFCGRHGCMERFVSGPGMSDDHQAVTGETLTAEEIAAQAEGGDGPAQATIDRYVDRLARGLAHVMNLVDPDVIVLGGGLSNLALLYDAVPARWGRYVFSDVVATRLVPPIHGDSSGVRGAAWLWPAE
jgi:predicted NBD/HSP70 family sugar kinase